MKSACGPVSQEVDLAALSFFRRLLLTTDGTVTELLETRYREPIRVVKLEERTGRLDDAVAGVLDTREAMIRRVLLQGVSSGRNYVYAEAAVSLERLPPRVKTALLTTTETLGTLLKRKRLETYREVLQIGAEPNSALCRFFGRAIDQRLLCRTYLIWHAGRPLVHVCERFPEAEDSGGGFDDRHHASDRSPM